MISGGLPQHKVSGVFFVGSDLDSSPCQHIVKRAAREAAIVVHGLNGKQNVALLALNTVVHCVGVAFSNEAGNHINHFRNMIGGVGNNRRRKIIQRGHIVDIGFGVALRHRTNLFAQFRRGGHNFVVDIGDVSRVNDLCIESVQEAIQRVKNHCGPGISDVNPVVDRGPADIQSDSRRVDRLEQLFAAGHCVV